VFSLKHIGAYFLLLVYSVSFGHQIIPHHHHEASDEHNHHLVGTHDHCVAEEETHNHVAHNDHFDEGFIDYLGCVLGNHEHNSSTECEFFELVSDQKNNTKTSNTSKVFDLTLVGFAGDLPPVSSGNCFHNQLSFNEDLLAQNRAMRGPPQA
jgi:hypothetical protein